MAYLEGSGTLRSLQVSLCTTYVARLSVRVKSRQESLHYAAQISM